MNISAPPSIYQANFQELLTSVDRVRQILENRISHTQAQPEQQEAALSIPSALERLSALFNLCAFERDILLLCVGMELDPNFALLCAEAQGNQERNYPTFSLALSIFPQSHWSVLAAQNPLQRWQLVEMGKGQTVT